MTQRRDPAFKNKWMLRFDHRLTSKSYGYTLGAIMDMYSDTRYEGTSAVKKHLPENIRMFLQLDERSHRLWVKWKSEAEMQGEIPIQIGFGGRDEIIGIMDATVQPTFPASYTFEIIKMSTLTRVEHKAQVLQVQAASYDEAVAKFENGEGKQVALHPHECDSGWEESYTSLPVNVDFHPVESYKESVGDLFDSD